MTNVLNITRMIDENLGHELYTACQHNDIAQVAALTSQPMGVAKWADAILAAASEKALEVASYCMRSSGDWISTTDRILVLVLYYESLEQAYRFLVESNLVNPEHRIDRYGQLLGAAVGLRTYRRHSLVEFLLEKGVDPDQNVVMYASKSALAAAAGHSDQRMVGLLLDHGAVINGSGALIYAAEKGIEENVRYLLTRGADVNEMVPLTPSRPSLEEMGSALHRAVRNGRVPIVEMLLDAGADVTLKDARGRTAGEIAVAEGMDGAILTILDTSC